MLKGTLILAGCAGSALALSVAAGFVALPDALSLRPEITCEIRDAFQLEPCPRAPAPAAATTARKIQEEPSGAEASRPAKPWDDPKWDDMVASKLLEILLKVPDDGVRTGSLDEPPAVEPPAAGQPAQTVPSPAGPERPVASALPPRSEPNPTGPVGPVASALPPASAAANPPRSEPSPWIAPGPAADTPAGAEPHDPPRLEREVAAADRIVPLPSALPELDPGASRASPHPLPPARPNLPGDQLALASTGHGEPEIEAAAHPATASRRAAEQFTAGYLKAWSSPNAEALAQIRKLSADRIEYYGKSISRDGWSQIKRTFAAKWPVRHYRPRGQSTTTECDQRGRCTVRAIVDWTTAHPGRGDTVTGSSKLELGIDLSGQQPVVYRESMLQIRSAVRRTLAPVAARPQARPPQPAEAPEDEDVMAPDPIY